MAKRGGRKTKNGERLGGLNPGGANEATDAALSAMSVVQLRARVRALQHEVSLMQRPPATDAAAVAEEKATALAAYRKTRNVSLALQAIGRSRKVLDAWRAGDPEFKRAWADVWEEAVDELEASAIGRAISGWTKPVWHNGKKVGEEGVYSPQLATFMLERNRREKYGQRVDVTFSPEEYARAVAETLGAQEAASRAALQSGTAASEGKKKGT